MSRIIRPWSNRIRPSSPGGRRGGGGGGGVTLTKSVDFDGLTQYVTGSGAPDGSADWVAGAWWRLTASHATGDRIIEISDGTTSNYVIGYFNGSGPTAPVTLLIRAGGAFQVLNFDTGQDADDTDWHLLAVAWIQSSGTFKVSVDGGAWQTAGTGKTHPAGLNQWRYGADGAATPTLYAPLRVALDWLLFGTMTDGEIAGYFANPQTYPAAEHVRTLEGNYTDSGSVGGWDLTAVNSPTIETDYPVAP